MGTMKRKTKKGKGAGSGLDMDAVRRRIETENLMGKDMFSAVFSDREIFVDLVRDVTGVAVSDLADIVITTETGFKPFEDSVEVKCDVLGRCELLVANVEGQRETSGFPAERMVYYACNLICRQIQSARDYRDIVPVYVIVIYEDKAQPTSVMASGLDGFMRDERPLLNLVSVSLKGIDGDRDVKEDARVILNMLKGPRTPELADKLAGHNVPKEKTEGKIKRVNMLVAQRLAALSVNEEETRMYNEYWTKEREESVMAAGVAEGMEKGKVEGKVEGLYVYAGMQPKRIAELLGIPEKRVLDLIAAGNWIPLKN